MHAKGGRTFSRAFAATVDDAQIPLDSKKRKFGPSEGKLPRIPEAKPTKRFAPIRGGRSWTISVAVPGSILHNLPTAEQRLATVARLARSLAIFCVDEVIVYDDDAAAVPSSRSSTTITRLDGSPDAYTGDSDPCHFVAQVLSFLECPPFMRRRLFPLHANLRHTALLPAVDMPHHPRPKAAWLPYVEGVTVPPAAEEEGGGGSGSVVDTGPCGGRVCVPDDIPPHTRVTLHLGTHAAAQQPVCADPHAPRAEGGYYWGYAVRRCASLSRVFTECPHAAGYDLSVGTSERGTPLAQVMAEHQQKRAQQKRRGYGHHQADSDDGAAAATPSFQHLVVVFGGPRGIELAADHDPALAAMHIRGPRTRELFDHWVDVLPGQGSRAIATDEAVPIALMGLRGLWEST
ncbi:deoxyribose-phosphate aldolase 2 [Cordyceps militaris CM01]|uniref:Deoxyribose-phosphate aldolase 2 n=1 Tax=Cordyceps militaris (strain CM01) TaxID=983644 RepID=G3JF74_CORMM|nr:deoxyribose-phosphate aldolase 2 [Cordyceps militaris CM01]EGX93514.1 deoxyribose-phosphate aldolase 2 [Cordyceps militaris CM01]